MTKKREKEEDVIKEQDIEKEVKEEIEKTEGETKAEVIDKNVHEELIKTAEKYLDNWKRCQADFENYKKDQEKRMIEFRKFASLDMVLQILPVIDNFEISLTHIPENEKESLWVQGILHIKKQMEQVLKDNGIEEIETKVGDEFNPIVHEAVSDTPAKGGSASGGKETNKIRKVLQKGYKIDGKVVRAARVIVK